MALLITGGAGFIGSHFIHGMRQHQPAVELVNLDALTYAGNLDTLADLAGDDHYHFVHGNILDQDLVHRLIEQYRVTAVINFAAESHVDRSIADPMTFIDTNIRGTAALLEVTRTAHCRFLQVSTDEVYGSLAAPQQASEASPLHPSSPYAASKASADLLVLAAHRTYSQDVVITRCTNNYGAYQFPEKLIPLMIQRALDHQPLPVYGDGENVRDWLHVTDHCRAIELALARGQSGEVYNIGGHNERTNLQIIAAVQTACGGEVVHVADRLGHDQRYALAATKIQQQLGWVPQVSFDAGLAATIAWYRTHESWWRPLLKR